MLDRIGPAEASSGRMDGAPAETIRQPRDRLKGQPQEHQHSAASWRDAGPTAPGKGCRCERQGWKPACAETASAPFTTARPEGGRDAESPARRICGLRRPARTGTRQPNRSSAKTRQATRHFGADSDDSSIAVSRDLMGYAVRACVWQFVQVRTIDE
jgi:hypothetical protein